MITARKRIAALLRGSTLLSVQRLPEQCSSSLTMTFVGFLCCKQPAGNKVARPCQNLKGAPVLTSYLSPSFRIKVYSLDFRLTERCALPSQYANVKGKFYHPRKTLLLFVSSVF